MKKLLALMLATCGLAAQPMLPLTQYTFGFLTNSTAADARAYLGAISDDGSVPMSGDLNMDGNDIVGAGDVAATTATISGVVTAGELLVGGVGLNSFSTPVQLHKSGERNITYHQHDIFTGGSTNGTNVAIGYIPMPAHTSAQLWVRASGSGPTNSANALLTYSAHRRAVDSVLVSTNRLGGTNFWAGVDGTNMVLYGSSELGETWDNILFLAEWSVRDNSAWEEPLVYLDFEETGTPEIVTTVIPTVNFDYDADPMEGDESALVGPAAYFIVPLPAATASSVYVAGRIRLTTGHASSSVQVDMRTASTAVAEFSTVTTGFTARAFPVGGTGSAATAETMTTTGGAWSLFQFRAKTGTDAESNDAEAEVWISNDVSVGWGTGVSQNDGTTSGDITRVFIRSQSSLTSGTYFDQIIISDSPIDINRLAP